MPKKTPKMTRTEQAARAAGWFPAREAHTVFRNNRSVCRHLRDGETYQPDTDSYMRTPLRHARNWADALRTDGAPRDA